jgi:hypothetical protein
LSQTVAATLERPRYSPGLILEDADLTAAVDYTRNLNRMLFRHLFGCGVICGLTVDASKKCGGITVTVSPGLALDGCGDPVELPRKVEITIDEKTTGQWEGDNNQKFWVVLCGKEKNCAPRSLVCEADEFDGVTQPTRIRSLAEISITRENPKCVCGCPSRADSKPNGQDGANMNMLPGAETSGRGQANGDDDPCQKEHEERDDCAADCGCGTACDCGCCVLLAEVTYDGKLDWVEKHEGIRRLVRPKMVRDHEPKRTSPPYGATSASAVTVTTDNPESPYLDVATGASMTRSEVIERFAGHLAKSGGTLERIEMAELGLAPARKPLEAEVAAKRTAITAEEAKRREEAAAEAEKARLDAEAKDKAKARADKKAEAEKAKAEADKAKAEADDAANKG